MSNIKTTFDHKGAVNALDALQQLVFREQESKRIERSRSSLNAFPVKIIGTQAESGGREYSVRSLFPINGSIIGVGRTQC